jgi:hypothetical protein
MHFALTIGFYFVCLCFIDFNAVLVRGYHYCMFEARMRGTGQQQFSVQIQIDLQDLASNACFVRWIAVSLR